MAENNQFEEFHDTFENHDNDQAVEDQGAVGGLNDQVAENNQAPPLLHPQEVNGESLQSVIGDIMRDMLPNMVGDLRGGSNRARQSEGPRSHHSGAIPRTRSNNDRTPSHVSGPRVSENRFNSTPNNNSVPYHSSRGYEQQSGRGVNFERTDYNNYYGENFYDLPPPRGYRGESSPRYPGSEGPRGYGSPRFNNSMGYNREDLSIKVRPFNPRETDWFIFKSHFEAIADQACWSDKTRCLKLMGALQGSLAGVTSGLRPQFTYFDLMSRLDEIHGISNDREDALLKLTNCSKHSSESIPMFAERIRQLVGRAYPRFNNKDRDEQALRYFLAGLPTKYDVRLNMRMKNFTNLRETAAYGARLEQIINDERGHSRQANHVRRIEENESEEEDLNMDDMKETITEICHKVIQERNKGFQKRKGLNKPERINQGQEVVKKTPNNSPCFGCGQLGHWMDKCPSKQVSTPYLKSGENHSENQSLN
jgi:hypothetical protein